MEISTFELLYKPFTPPLGGGTEALGRRVLQGYFLTISNLGQSEFPVSYRLSDHLARPGRAVASTGCQS